MQVVCLHGYFQFREERLGEVAKFNTLYEQDLVSRGDYFTFELLATAKNYSLLAGLYSGVVASKTYAGEPWEVMEQNQLVYDFNLKTLLPLVSVTNKIDPLPLYNGFTARGLILPGSINKTWMRVKSYKVRFNLDDLIFNYSELTYA